MKSKLPRPQTKSKPVKSMDTLFEEYMSKLEQKVVSQTEQLKTITDNATSCLFMIDAQGNPTFMNPAAQKTTGYTLAEIKKKALYDVLHRPHDTNSRTPKAVCPITIALRDMEPMKDQEDTFIRKDGSLFPVAFSISPFHEEGKSKGAVLEFRDITQRKELERQKDDFIGVASHELKTPVTSMKMYTQVLKKRFEKEGDLKAAESLEKIDVQINKLTSLIADLLDVTRSQTGNLNLRPEKFDLDTLINEIVENMQLTTTKHIIKIKGKANVNITADRDRTGQVLINFLSNAIKYSPQSDKIIVSVACDKKDVIVSVRDFGIGIPPDKISQVFDRFMRVSSPEMETFAGLGLGLYISYQIITRQDGRVWVESEQNKGTTFYFSLPVKAQRKNKAKL